MKRCGWRLLLPMLFVLTSCRPSARVMWNRYYDSGDEDLARAVIVDGKGAVVGGIWEHSVDDVVLVDWQILGYDTGGRLMWRRVCDFGDPEWLSRLAFDRRGDIVALGSLTSRDSDSAWALVAKFDRNGEMLWSRELALGLATQGNGLAIDSSNNILVVGSVFLGADSATDDIFVACLDSTGTLVRHRTFDFGADESGEDVILDQLGNIVITAGMVPDDSGPRVTQDLLLAKLGPDCTMLWHHLYDAGGDELAGGLVVDDENGILVGLTEVDSGGSSTSLLRYDADGRLLVCRRYTTGEVNAALSDIVLDKLGAVIGCGSVGIEESQSCVVWRYEDGWFADLLNRRGYRAGAFDAAAGIALSPSGDVIMAGSSVEDANADILTLRLGFRKTHK